MTAATPDLSTTYLGLPLTSPFMVGASPLADHLDTAKRLEDCGCAALVLHSLFEEQITQAVAERIHHMDRFDRQFATVLSYFPEPERYALGPDEYLEHLRRVKSAVRIPVIASLNGTTAEEWLRFARLIEEAGADGLELNMYEVATNLDSSAMAIENGLCQIVQDLKHELKIPIAVKLSPFFTAFGHFARELSRAGADGLVLFNRFLQPDIDIRHLTFWPRLELSDSSELLLRLHWLAVLNGHVPCSLAVSGGVATPADGIKAILAGASVVQQVSAILRHGPAYFVRMHDELRQWMDEQQFTRLEECRGRLSLAKTADPNAFERGGYLQTLSNWAALLAYQAYLRTHPKDTTKS